MNKVINYKNFLRQHATKGLGNLWLVYKDIPAFKVVRTYREDAARKLRYSPHSDLDSLKARFYDHSYTHALYGNPAIVNLIIPAGAVLNFEPDAWSDDFGKLRADKAIVHSIHRRIGGKPVAYGVSVHDGRFVYVNGKMTEHGPIEVKPTRFDTSGATCAAGIHFFVDIERAMSYRV